MSIVGVGVNPHYQNFWCGGKLHSTMRVFKILLASGLLAVFLIGAILFLIGYFKPKPAGFLIETTPAATVFIDGVQVGRTPYEGTKKPGEVTIKLVPESKDVPLLAFETKVILASGIKTIIRREFAETEEASSGEIISFEKASSNETSLAVISIPDSAQVTLDGTVRGFAPYKTSAITAGEHQLIISASGYRETNLSLKTQSGYKLTAVIKLAKVAEPQPTSAPKEKKTLIEILPTPTGFLRVRSEPKVSASEVAQVKPGEKFPLLEEDQSSGWFKIEYLSGQTGWVSNQYAKKISGD